MRTFFKSWALWTAVTLGTAWLTDSSTMFRVAAWGYGSAGLLAVLFWLTPLGRAAFAEFERQELSKRRERLDARLKELDAGGHGTSPGEG